ncbi:MAG: mandelate racemase/muconate lactonizing enzyme family protein [Candidatus Latescibacterota bacterium]|nr:mandelate racemase/muconate lactonizing enzyme family protein [Candidatus Latescibacterota bacterium]
MAHPKIAAVETYRLEPPPPESEGTKTRRASWGATFRQATPLDRFDDGITRKEPGGSIWVKVTADDGSYGLGNTDTGNTAHIFIRDCLAPSIVDQEVGAIDACNDRMWHAGISFGMEGAYARAVAGVDLALWDLWGKTVDQPVYRLAGGPHRRSLPAYITGNDVDWGIELGFKRFKLARPFGVYDSQTGLDGTAEYVAKTRETIGPDSELMLDCWMAYDVDYAVRMCEVLRPYRMAWMEEMLKYYDWEGHRVLRERVPWQTLATGEHWSTRYPGIRAIREGLIDLIQADIKWVGGFTEAMKIAHAADAASIPMCLHTGANELFGQHWSFAMPNVRLIEFFQGSAPGVPLEECHIAASTAEARRGYRMLPGTPVPRNGFIGLPPGPGFGLHHLRDEWFVPWEEEETS